MRVFVTGASGFIGSAVVPELVGAGHEVVGLARSEASAARIEAAGAKAVRGGLTDHDVLRSAAAESDGVIHLAFIHDFSNFAESARVDRAAIDLFGEVLAGSDRPLSIASGCLGVTPGRLATERDLADPAINPRHAAGAATLALAGQGVRSSVVRLAPSVHDEGDKGFMAVLIANAREKGVAGYVGDGTQRWPGIHRQDAATLFRLAVEKAPAGTVLHGTGEQGTAIRDIAEVMGRHLGVPTASIAPDDAVAHFGFLGAFLQLDSPVSNDITREVLGWEPTGPTLLEDLDAGHYYKG
jgi:nucleoside-diphosphate-sugar epimerase